MEIFKLFGTIMVDNSKANESISKTGEKSDGLASKLGTGLKVAGGIAAGAILAVGSAAVAMAVKGVNSADEVKKAMNGLQSQTGVTDTEMKGMEDTLLKIYGNNFGESFDDIAKSMGNINQQTGLTGKALEDTTTNALIMRDTFEMEVGESVRSVDMLMKQFGISSEEAYNLLAQGAQGGLDKNQNLLDSVNEYSVYFKQMGFDSEEMFNMFANGAETGVFDIDKLGDSMKEFGIRSKDASKGTMAAYSDLGLNADELTKKFIDGGDGAQDAFAQVSKALLNVDDKVLQNQIGVSLFGTMWEDLGIEAIGALTNVQGEFDKTAATMDKINQVKYDSFGEAIAGIGRTVEANFLVPIGQKLVPVLQTMAQWIIDNMPQIQAFMDKAFQVIGDVVGTAVEVVQWLVDAFGKLFESSEGTGDGISTTWENVKEMFSTVFESISELITSFITMATAFWNEWGDEITLYLTAMWEVIGIVFDTAFKVIIDIFNIFTALFNGDWKALWEGVKKLYKDIWDGLKAYIGIVFDAIAGILTSIGAKIKTSWDTMWNNIKTSCDNTWTNIKTAVANGVNDVWTKAKELATKAMSALKDLPGDALQMGKDFVMGMINGIGNMASKLGTKVKEMATGAVKAAKKVLGISSPSRVMMEVGQYTAEGMADGITKNSSMVTQAVKDMTAFKDADYSINAVGTNNGIGVSNKSTANVRPININIYNPNFRDDRDITKLSRELQKRIDLNDLAFG